MAKRKIPVAALPSEHFFPLARREITWKEFAFPCLERVEARVSDSSGGIGNRGNPSLHIAPMYLSLVFAIATDQKKKREGKMSGVRWRVAERQNST